MGCSAPPRCTSRSRCGTQPGVADRFLADLRQSVEEVRANPGVSTGMAPVYGMAASLPGELVHAMLAAYLDITFEV